MNKPSQTPYHLVIPAAGIGSRFGANTPKQYALINGQPLIHHAIAAAGCGNCLSITIALHAEDSYWQLPASASVPLHTVVGGKERADSVYQALLALQERSVADDGVVLVHDAARPFVPDNDIHALLAAVESSTEEGAILAAPVADTIKLVEEGNRISHTVDRSNLWRALTPQAFRLKALISALEQCQRENAIVTDEASAIEAVGGRVEVVKGSAANIKVTLPEDLQSVASYMEQI
ncbi:MAG: 2-C-methyl-D-erythritol 4-phosphate cytidylyltransferase [Gammaproteobacteria bacterium]|nr:2-C-methyl-D-erythritol 4-phosphate cytidylyltransferase [Gammaproteobacteria bacterium]